jgi:hypothetical protein
MTKEQRRPKRLPGFGWLALIFIVPAVLYLATVYSQLSVVEARNLRLLAGAAERVQHVFENAVRTVENYRNSTIDVDEFNKRQPYLDLASRDGKNLPIPDSAAEVGVFSHGLDQLIFVSTGDGNHVAFKVDFSRILRELPLDNNPNPRTPPDDDLEKYPLDHSSSPRGALLDEGAFDYLVLTDKDGRVITDTHRAAHTGIRITHLQEISEQGSGEAKNDKDNEVTLEHLKRSSQLRTVRVAGTRYRLFSRPVQIITGKTAENVDVETWVLAGLISSDRMLRDTLTVAPQLASFLVILFILGFLSWPILKVLTMDRRERMRFFDLYLLPMSSFAVLVVLTATLASLDGNAQLRRDVSLRLESLAENIDGRFTGELGDLRRQLDDYDSELKTQLVSDQVLSRKVFDTSTPKSLLAARNLLGSEGPVAEKITRDAKGREIAKLGISSPKTYEYLTSVFWMNEEGTQFAKANIRPANTAWVKLDHRDYFKAIADHLYWGADSDWFFQTYRSITTGERSSALSAPSSIEGQTVVAAITGAMRSVMDPVVPLGFSFALIDDQGTVQFHSDGRRALEEDFFSEVGDSERLRAIMASRTSQHFNTRYLTRPHQLFVRPLSSGPWWIVTMFDSEMSRTVVIETFGRTIILALLYVLGLNLPLLIWLAFTRRHVRWIWPDPKRVGLYRAMTGQHVAFGLVYLFLLASGWFGLTPTWTLVLTMGLPAAAVGLAFLRCIRSPQDDDTEEAVDPTGGENGSFLVWRTAAATTLWIVLAVLPTVGLYRLEWRQQIGAMVKATGLDASHALAERAQQQPFGSTYENVPVRDGFFESLWENDTDLYLESLIGGTPRLESTGGPMGEDQQSGVESRDLSEPWTMTDVVNHRAERLLPLYNRASRYLRYVHDDQSHAGRLMWTGSDEAVDLTITGLTKDRSATITYTPKALSGGLGWYQIIGGAVLLVVLVVWVRFGTHHVLFGAIAPQLQPLDVNQIVLRAEAANVIALVASPVDRRKLLTHREIDAIDLGGDHREMIEKSVAELAAASGPPVVCDHFEDDLVNAELRHWKLDQLERLLAAGTRKIILPSAINLFEDLLWCARVRPPVEGEAPTQTVGVGPAGSVVLSTSETRRWGRVLSEFILEPMGLTNEPQDLNAEADRAAQQAAMRALDRWQIRELVSTSGLWPAPVFNPESFRGLRRKDALESFVETFEGVYWSLWTSSSPDEQLVLVHLAQERAVNPKQAVTLRRLLQRGLVVRDPVLRMMNESFTIFVRRIHEPVEIRRWEREARESIGWQQLRWAFLSLLTVLGLFLFATQQGLFQATVGFVSALAVGIPGVLKLIANMHGGGRTAPPA